MHYIFMTSPWKAIIPPHNSYRIVSRIFALHCPLSCLCNSGDRLPLCCIGNKNSLSLSLSLSRRFWSLPRPAPHCGEGGVPHSAPHCGEGGIPRSAPPPKNDQNRREVAGQNKGSNLNLLKWYLLRWKHIFCKRISFFNSSNQGWRSL